MASDDKPMNRRRFFREGFAELLKPLGRAVQPLEEIARQIGKLEDPLAPSHSKASPQIHRAEHTVSYNAPGYHPPMGDEEEFWIRPPGARPEEEFVSICSRCSNCVNACPVSAIKLDHSSAMGAGAPYIDPDAAACVMCDELACMTNCPSSALRIVGREEIDLGLAEWNSGLCLRTVVGEQCTMCVDHCPVGASAIEISDNHVVVHEGGCTGCGSCQNNCPTQPKSITITPKSKRLAR